MTIRGLNEYQELVMRTAGGVSEAERLGSFGLGIAGESGEIAEIYEPFIKELFLTVGLNAKAGNVADMIKKIVSHGHQMDTDKFIKELGDVLWYVGALAMTKGVSLEEVATKNIDKLKARYPQGFSEEASIKRVDTKEEKDCLVAGNICAPRGKITCCYHCNDNSDGNCKKGSLVLCSRTSCSYYGGKANG